MFYRPPERLFRSLMTRSRTLACCQNRCCLSPQMVLGHLSSSLGGASSASRSAATSAAALANASAVNSGVSGSSSDVPSSASSFAWAAQQVYFSKTFLLAGTHRARQSRIRQSLGSSVHGAHQARKGTADIHAEKVPQLTNQQCDIEQPSLKGTPAVAPGDTIQRCNQAQSRTHGVPKF
jgi:hypothetical protein